MDPFEAPESESRPSSVGRRLVGAATMLYATVLGLGCAGFVHAPPSTRPLAERALITLCLVAYLGGWAPAVAGLVRHASFGRLFTGWAAFVIGAELLALAVHTIADPNPGYVLTRGLATLTWPLLGLFLLATRVID